MMTRTMTAVRQYLAAAFLIAIGLMASGCGDTGSTSEPAQLGSLSVSPGTLQPSFNPETTNYTVQLSSDVTSVTITATPRIAGDTVRIDNQQVSSQTITLDSPGSTKFVSIVVTDTGTGGASQSYTVRLTRAALAGNNSLQNLTVSPGTLAPTFSADTLRYTVDVANNVTSVTVTPTLQDLNATMTVDGKGATSGQAQTVTLNGPGSSTVIDIVVTSQNGTARTYLVTVGRGGLSSNNFLRSLSISPGTLIPVFAEDAEDYTVNVASTVASVAVTPTRQDPNATITVNGQATNSGQARTITLNGAGSNTLINIAVSAQNGSRKTYTVNVIRAAPGGNNNLSALTVSPGNLEPAFSASRTSYTVDVASSVTSIAVTPTRQDSNATITVNGQSTTSGQARTITLNPAGQNTTISIVVTAQNGVQKAYFVSVNRAALGGNNNLSALTVSPGSLSPAFSASRTSYAVSVGSNVSSITVTATKADSNAAMTINNQGTNSGQARSIPLGAQGSSTEIDITVTAPSGSQKIYTVNVTRAALGENNNLSALTVSPGSLSPSFSASRASYTVNVGSDVSSITVTATKADSNASMTINGQGTNSGQARSISLGAPGSSTEIDITLTAPNGTPKTYTVNVNRAALGGNNNLSGLTVSPGSLSPSFSASRTSYTVSVGSGVSSITVTATKADSNATLTINGQGTNSRSISLPEGPSSTEIDITVVAPNGDDKQYLITVNRAALADPPAPASAPDLIAEDDSCLRDLVTNQCFPGTSDSDNITNVSTPRFRIPQPGAGETPSLYVDDSKVGATFDQGANTLRPTSALSDGDHTITSTVTNGGGESPQSPSLEVEINTVAPGFP